MDSVKSQSIFHGRVSRDGAFQCNEAIVGELVVGSSMPVVYPGQPTPMGNLEKPVRFKGLVRSVTEHGEVTRILVKELLPNEGLTLPTVISLSSLDSYTFSTCPYYRVEAYWDDEAQVWSAFSEDIAGLTTEADTLETLRDKLRVMIPELLELNQALPDDLFEIMIDLTSYHQDLLEVS